MFPCATIKAPLVRMGVFYYRQSPPDAFLPHYSGTKTYLITPQVKLRLSVALNEFSLKKHARFVVIQWIHG